MKALILGAGRIGCGFAGQLLREAGYDLVVADRDPALVDHLNRTGRYDTHIVWGRESDNITVDGVEAISTQDPRLAIQEIANADLVVTALGVGNLPSVAPLIAAGLRRRDAPLNVIAFENLGNAGSYLRELVAEHLPADFPIDRHGFSGAVVSRAVTKRIWREGSSEPARFIGDPPRDFVVDSPRLREPMPIVDGMVLADNFPARMQRKLYVYSAGHATCAYLGNLKGYHYVHTAIRDLEIRAIVIEAMAEGQRGLAAVYGREFAGDRGTLEEIVRRFENPGLCDPIVRVARDPLRKLARWDRLAGAAALAEHGGIWPHHLALAMAAALCFRDSSDPSSTSRCCRPDITDLEQILREVAGLNPVCGVGKAVADTWGELSKGLQRDNMLLRLDGMLWACEGG